MERVGDVLADDTTDVEGEVTADRKLKRVTVNELPEVVLVVGELIEGEVAIGRM